jgi:hypothetical protein
MSSDTTTISTTGHSGGGICDSIVTGLPYLSKPDLQLLAKCLIFSMQKALQNWPSNCITDNRKQAMLHQ